METNFINTRQDSHMELNLARHKTVDVGGNCEIFIHNINHRFGFTKCSIEFILMELWKLL